MVRVCGVFSSFSGLRRPERQSLADRFGRVGIRKESIGERFRDDGHLLGASAVIAAEVAAAQKRNAHRVQVTVADACHVDGDERRRYVRVRLQRYRRGAARKSSGRPSATVTDATPLAFARLSRRLRIRKPRRCSGAAASSFNGAAYSRSDSNPRSAVAVARTRSSDMPLMTSKGTAIATCNAAVTR